MRDVIVVVQKGDHSLGYYDFETGAEIGRVPVDPFPHEFTLSPDRRLAYLANFGVALAEDHGPGGNTVSVVDIAARRRVGTIDCGESRRPHAVAFDGAGKLYVLSEGASALLVVDDPATGRVTQRLHTAGRGSHMLSVTRDGRVVFSSNMESNTITAIFPRTPERPPVVIPVGRHPEGSVFDTAEARLFVMNRESAEISVIDVERLAVCETIPTPPGPVRVCRDGRRLYIALYHGCGLLTLDLDHADRQQVTRLADKAISVSYHPASGTALLSTLAHAVCLVNPAEARVMRSFTARNDPDPIAVVRLAS